jgi:hypothetical protein
MVLLNNVTHKRGLMGRSACSPDELVSCHRSPLAADVAQLYPYSKRASGPVQSSPVQSSPVQSATNIHSTNAWRRHLRVVAGCGATTHVPTSRFRLELSAQVIECNLEHCPSFLPLRFMVVHGFLAMKPLASRCVAFACPC